MLAFDWRSQMPPILRGAERLEYPGYEKVAFSNVHSLFANYDLHVSISALKACMTRKLLS